MLAKAVANHTTASFIRVVGSEFVQKYLGEVTELKLKEWYSIFQKNNDINFDGIELYFQYHKVIIRKRLNDI